MSAGYSVSLFTDWMNQKVSQVWVKSRPGAGTEITSSDFYGARAADRDVHPIISLGAENCTPQMGVPGPWYERLPHFKMGFMPSSGEELQAEFFVPRENAPDVLQAIERKKEQIFPHLHISEIRTVAADDFWLSPASGRNVVAFHFTWKKHPEEVPGLIQMVENELDPYGGVPHWGKLFSLDPALLHKRYPKMNDFLALARKYDPEGKLRNAYLDLNLFG
jgi:xylitol oxidase